MSRLVTLAGYAAIAIVAAAWEVVSVRRHSVMLGALVLWVAQGRVTRWLLLMGWAWLGWHLFVRGTVTFLGR